MNEKILIVEDEPAIAENVIYALQTEGFNPIWHNVGQNVLSLLHRETIDLIILDIGLPDLNGFELCKSIRQKFSIPLIFLTARSEEIDRIVGLEIGADDYVSKPFSPRELTARVKAILRRTHPTNPALSPLLKTPFAHDPTRQTITYFGHSLDLSRYEYFILKQFIHRPGQVFSRQQLMDLIWDEPSASLDRTIDSHIKNIRAKLKKICSDIDPIRTHRGLGYSLKENL